jgi:hypothetical protein
MIGYLDYPLVKTTAAITFFTKIVANHSDLYFLCGLETAHISQ